jgi:hypothetical protein
VPRTDLMKQRRPSSASTAFSLGNSPMHASSMLTSPMGSRGGSAARFPRPQTPLVLIGGRVQPYVTLASEKPGYLRVVYHPKEKRGDEDPDPMLLSGRSSRHRPVSPSPSTASSELSGVPHPSVLAAEEARIRINELLRTRPSSGNKREPAIVYPLRSVVINQ